MVSGSGLEWGKKHISRPSRTCKHWLWNRCSRTLCSSKRSYEPWSLTQVTRQHRCWNLQDYIRFKSGRDPVKAMNTWLKISETYADMHNHILRTSLVESETRKGKD